MGHYPTEVLRRRWQSIKERIRSVYPIASDEQLQYREGKEEQLISRLQDITGKSREQTWTIISIAASLDVCEENRFAGNHNASYLPINKPERTIPAEIVRVERHKRPAVSEINAHAISS